jgi:hypothetical protein
MVIKKILAFLLVCSISISLKAEKVFDFNSTCQQAYAEITKLKINNGQQLINQARQQNRNNLVPDMLEGYIDFLFCSLTKILQNIKNVKTGSVNV